MQKRQTDFRNPDKRDMIQILRRIESVRLLLKNDTQIRCFGVLYPKPDSIDVVLYCDNVTLTITQKQFNELMKQSGFGQFKLPDSVEMYVKPIEGQRLPEPRKYVYLIEELNSGQNCSVSPYNVHSNNVHHLSHMACHNKIGYRCIYEGCYLYFKLEDKQDAIEHVKDKHKHLLADEPNCGGGGGPTKFLRQVGITDSEESVIGRILCAQPTDQQADKSLNANPCEHHLDCPYCEKVFYYYSHLRDHCEREHEYPRLAPATNMRASSCASSSALSANTSHHQQVNPNVDREFEYLDTLYQSLQLRQFGIECNSNNLAFDGLSSSDEPRAHNTIGDSLIDSNFEQIHASTSNSCVIMNGTTNPVSITTTTIDPVQQTKQQTNLSNQNGTRKRQLHNDHDYCDDHSRETSTNVNAAAGSSSSSANASQAHVDKVVQQLVPSEVFTRSKRSKVSKIDDNVETLTTVTIESPTRDQFCFECHKWVAVPISCSACQRSYHEECVVNANVFGRQQIALETYKTWKGRSNKDTGIATLESNLNVCDECVLPIVGEMFFRVNNASNEATLEQDLKAAFFCFAQVLIEFCNKRKDPGDKVIIKRRIPHHMIISPIDLNEIESKADQYKSIEHFMSDIKLLIHNRHIVAHHQRVDRSVSLANLMEHAESEALLFHMCYSCRIMFHIEFDEYKPPEIFPTEEKKTPFGVMFQIPCAFLHKVVWVQTNGSWLPAKVFQSYVEGAFEAQNDIFLVITFGFQQSMLVQASELFKFSKKPPGLNGGQWGNPHLAIQEAESYLNKIDCDWYEKLPEIALPFDGELYMDPPQDAEQLMKDHWKCANCPKVLGPNNFRLDSCIFSYCSKKCKDAFLGRV